MCLLLLQHRTRADAPLVLLANRDEARDRAFEPPRLLDPRAGVFAPRDKQAGGTWLGVNRDGLVAALTNRRGEDLANGARSRGLLVLDVLRQPTAARAVRFLEEHLPHFAYAGFHLLVSDGDEAFVVRHRGRPEPTAPESADVLYLAPGVHVLTNLHEPGELPVPDAGRPRDGETLEETLARLERLAADEETELPGGHRILKRGEAYGTVCSAILAPPRFAFAAGPPGQAPFLAIPLPR